MLNKVIRGFLTRDMGGRLGVSAVFPSRVPQKGIWISTVPSIPLAPEFFPQITWKHNPVEVEICITVKYPNIDHLLVRGMKWKNK